MDVNNDDTVEKIEVLRTTDTIIHTYLQAIHKAKGKWDYYADIKSLSGTFGIEPIKKALLYAKERRNITIRFVTEITRDNIPYCKEIMKIGEVGHLDGVKGNFGISDTEYIAIAIPFGPAPIIPHAIYSNVKEDLQQQHYIFEVLWNKTIPAEQKIREIEGGFVIEKTEVMYGTENVIDTEVRFFSEAKTRIDTCMDRTRPQLAIGIEAIRMSFVKAKSKSVQLRYLTEITNDNLSYCKEIMKLVDEFRHLDGIKGNFMISEVEYLAPITSHDKITPADTIIVSSVKEIVEHQQYVFDSFWNRAIIAEQRIAEIEGGVEPDIIEVIQNSSRSRDLYLNLVNNSREEIMLIFPTTNAFVRQHKIGVIDASMEAAKLRSVKVRILMPAHELTEDRVQQLKQYHYHINVRYIEQMSGTKATFLVVDRKSSLVMELKDDSKFTFDEAIGLSTYSTSRSGVLSYVAIFENFWTQTELHKELQDLERIEKEFINVAAHELKNPIQPILSLSQLLRSTERDRKEEDYLDIIIRNAKRLQRLTEDILDIAKIESRSLQLQKETFNLNQLVQDAVEDSRNQITKENKDQDIRISSPVLETDSIFIEADKSRVNQVISNLLSNAIKFTRKGTISITLEKREEYNGSRTVVFRIKDNGSGINHEILPRLFTKFTTGSHTGTGLGLFISKSIVEAHGGRIWAENNADGKGATFTFSLPI